MFETGGNGPFAEPRRDAGHGKFVQAIYDPVIVTQAFGRMCCSDANQLHAGGTKLLQPVRNPRWGPDVIMHN